MRFHAAGTDMKVWAEPINDTSYLEYKSTVAGLTAWGSTNGGTPSSLTGVTAVYNSNMDMFLVTFPSGQLPANGNNFFAVVDWTGIIDLKIEAYITAQLVSTTELATVGSNVNSIKTIIDLLTADPLGAIAAATWDETVRTLTEVPVGAATTEELTTIRLDVEAVKAITDELTLSNITNDILNEVIDPTHHTTTGSLARLLYILYCSSVGGVVNTQTSRAIKDAAGATILTNTITSGASSVTRSGGHE